MRQGYYPSWLLPFGLPVVCRRANPFPTSQTQMEVNSQMTLSLLQELPS